MSENLHLTCSSWGDRNIAQCTCTQSLRFINFRNKSRWFFLQNCRSLFVRYDIGVVAPTFAHEKDRFLKLEVVDIAESHVLYKNDMLAFLTNAISESSCFQSHQIYLYKWKKIIKYALNYITLQTFSTFRSEEHSYHSPCFVEPSHFRVLSWLLQKWRLLMF